MRESSLKRTVDEGLQYLANMGLLMYHRLNSGEAYIGIPPAKLRKIKLCDAGTADFEIVLNGKPIYVELKGEGGKLSHAQYDFSYECLRNGAEYRVIRKWEQLLEYLGKIEPKIKEAMK